MEILPAIDLRDGKCVRLLQGDYARQIDYADDPVAVARRFEQAGARWVHVVDLDGAREGRPANLDVVRRVLAGTGLKVQLGGGLRDTDTIEALLEMGVARCVVGTRALEDWEWFESLVRRPACSGRLALGLDAREGKLAVRGWTRQTDETPISLAARVADWPLAAIIYTDIARDGMLAGPNLAAMRALAEASAIPVIASGGVTSLEDVHRLKALPVWGAIVGRALYENKIDLAEAIRLAES